MSLQTLTVSQVNFFIKSLIEGDGRLSSIFVVGEISNLTDHYRSGHIYFSIKDEKSVLKAVMFSSSAKRLKFRPTDGMRVIVRGRVSVYEPTGQYQLYAEDIQPDGMGALSLAYEQLKARLEQEGLFADEHKKPIPKYPQKIGVITSPTGAAVQDILQITARRWPIAEIILAPVLVQGDSAYMQLISAVREMNRQNACDVIIIGRGGGSLEDLWSFNDEGLAYAIYRSEIPVISAVGHETDFTICDFVADLRAPTPSAAAELATPDIEDELARLFAYNNYFCTTAADTVNYLRQSIDLLTQNSPLTSPEQLLLPHRLSHAELFGSMVSAIDDKISQEKQQLSLAVGKLDTLSPLKVLARGYSFVTKNGEPVKTTAQLATGDKLTLTLADGKVNAEVTERTEKIGGKV